MVILGLLVELMFVEEDEPLNYLKEECQKPVRDWLSEIKADVLLEMIIFIINAIYNDKGIQNTKESLVGIKIFLQLIVRTRPEIFVDNISEIQKRVSRVVLQINS